MGWWEQTLDGHSFANGIKMRPDDPEFVWGDGPADAMADALDRIEKEFKDEWGRPPTKLEVFAGLRFDIRCRDDWPGEID